MPIHADIFCPPRPASSGQVDLRLCWSGGAHGSVCTCSRANAVPVYLHGCCTTGRSTWSRGEHPWSKAPRGRPAGGPSGAKAGNGSKRMRGRPHRDSGWQQLCRYRLPQSGLPGSQTTGQPTLAMHPSEMTRRYPGLTNPWSDTF